MKQAKLRLFFGVLTSLCDYLVIDMLLLDLNILQLPWIVLGFCMLGKENFTRQQNPTKVLAQVLLQ